MRLAKFLRNLSLPGGVGWFGQESEFCLELKGMILTPDPAATCEASLETLIRGLAPA